MLRIKKVISYLLVFSLLLTVLTSCSKSESADASKTGENGSYVPKKNLDITVWNTQGTDYVAKELENNIVEDWLVNKTKVKVTNVYGNDGNQWGPKLTQLLAGNNLPDILWCQAGQGPAHFSKLDEMDLVWELTPEMLQKYAPDVWKRIPESYWESIMVKGKILGIPFNFNVSEESLPNLSKEELNYVYKTNVISANDVMSQPGGYLYIRDDILKQFYPEAKSYNELLDLLNKTQEPIGDELLDIPIHSTQDFINFMYKIQEAGLKEDGKAVYAYGYSGGDNWEALTWLGADMYGYKTHQYPATWNAVKERIEVPLVGEVVKQAAKTQNKMINDRVIDPESLAHTTTLFQQKVMTGQYAICSANMLGDVRALNEQLAAAGKTFRFRPFITQVPAKEEYPAFKERQLWNESLCLLKTLKEDELHQVLNWINAQFTDEYEEIVNWGPPEAKLYTQTADGKRVFTDERFTRYYLENDTGALKPEETKGLQGPAGYQTGGLFGVAPVRGISRWTPAVMAKKEKYLPNFTSGFKFSQSSKHIANVKVFPQCKAQSPIYADIPEVVTYWGARQQWEEPFKLALASADGEFDERWNHAVSNLYNIVNVDEMAAKMTEIAKPIAEMIRKNNAQ